MLLEIGVISVLSEIHERQQEVVYDPDRLKARRLEHGYTQRTIADLLGIRYQNYQPYELPKAKGGYAPKGARMAEIARILETSPEYLRGETDDPRPRVVLSEDELELVRAYRSLDLNRINQLYRKKARKDMGE